MSSAMGCPHCRNVIQTAHAVPAGKQVKCPHCKNFFLAPPQVSLPVAQVAAAPVAQVVPPKMPPPPGMPPPPPPSSHKKHKKDRKHRKHRHHSHDRSSSSGKGLFKIAAGVLALIVLMGVGAGASLLFSNRGSVASTTEEEETPTEVASRVTEKQTTPEKKTAPPTEKTTQTRKEAKKDPAPPVMKGLEDPLVLVPANSAVILGGNLKALAEVPAFKGLLEGRLAGLAADIKRDTGMELIEFADTAVIALHGSPANLAEAKTTLILKTGSAYDVKKLTGSPAIDGQAEAKDRTYHPLKADSGLAGGRQGAILFAPSDRLLVLSDLPKADFEALALEKPALAEETLTLLGELQKQPVWAYVPLRNFAKELHAGLMADKAPEELKPVADALADAEGVVLWAAPEGEATLLAAGLICADDAAAQQALTALTDFWKRLKTPDAMMAKLPPEIGKLAAELRAALEFRRQGEMVIAQIAEMPVEPLVSLLAGGEAGVKSAYPQLLAGLSPPPPLTLTKEEQTILALTNKAREGAQLPPIKVNPILMKMAREHAANMAKQEKADDVLDDKDHMARLGDAGYKFKEKMTQANLVSAGAAILTPQVAVEAWLGDEASKMNILGPYTEIGIGLAISDKKNAYIYQVFAVPEE